MNNSARLEKALKEIQKLPGNKKCADCSGTGALAPNNVCLNFSTFVCTNCASVHRSFSHRVKGTSMSTFSAEEVAKLQAGGNEAARALYQHEFNMPLPDSEDLAGITAFVKAVYVDKRYMAGQSRAAPAAAARPSAAAPVRSSFDTFAGPDTHAPPPLPSKKPLPAPPPAFGGAVQPHWDGGITTAQALPQRGGSPAWGGGEVYQQAGTSRPPSAASLHASSDAGGGGQFGLSAVSSATSVAASQAADPFGMMMAPPQNAQPAPPLHPQAGVPHSQPQSSQAPQKQAGRNELPLDLFSDPTPTAVPQQPQFAAPSHGAAPPATALPATSYPSASLQTGYMQVPQAAAQPYAQPYAQLYAQPSPAPVQAQAQAVQRSSNPFDNASFPAGAAFGGAAPLQQQGAYGFVPQQQAVAYGYAPSAMMPPQAGWPQPQVDASAAWGAAPPPAQTAPAPDPFADLGIRR